MSEYDDINARMSANFGPRATIESSGGLQSIAGTIGGQGAGSAEEAQRLGDEQKASRLARERARMERRFQSTPEGRLQSNIEAAFDTLFKSRGGGVLESAPRQPWTLAGFIESGSAKIRVAPGMVNSFVPTIGGTSIAAAEPPALTVTGSSGRIYLDATVDTAGVITALVLASASAVPADTTTHKYKLVGTWTSSGGVFTSVVSILNANQTLYLCGGTAIWEA